jgi:hypothetical protein
MMVDNIKKVFRQQTVGSVFKYGTKKFSVSTFTFLQKCNVNCKINKIKGLQRDKN